MVLKTRARLMKWDNPVYPALVTCFAECFVAKKYANILNSIQVTVMKAQAGIILPVITNVEYVSIIGNSRLTCISINQVSAITEE